MKVTIDPKICIGTSQCAEAAPEAYMIDPDTGQAKVRPGASDEALLRGAEACPVMAILVQAAQAAERGK